MHKIFKISLAALALMMFCPDLPAQEQSQGGVVRRSSPRDRKAEQQQDGTQVTERMQRRRPPVDACDLPLDRP